MSWVLDADLREAFTSLDRTWMERFLEYRIADRRVLRLIQKWLGAGVIEEGSWAPEEGVGQGTSISPLLANVYFHYALDLWVHQWRKRSARGEVYVVRFCDDFVVGFQHRDDAERVRTALGERLAEFALELNADKTRLIEFGRFAARNREARGEGKPRDALLPRLYARLREDEKGTLQAQAGHGEEADAREAARGQGRAAATHAPAHP